VEKLSGSAGSQRTSSANYRRRGVVEDRYY
jgi:hypothetical protein